MYNVVQNLLLIPKFIGLSEARDCYKYYKYNEKRPLCVCAHSTYMSGKDSKVLLNLTEFDEAIQIITFWCF